jgi:hypothetical protein
MNLSRRHRRGLPGRYCALVGIVASLLAAAMPREVAAQTTCPPAPAPLTKSFAVDGWSSPGCAYTSGIGGNPRTDLTASKDGGKFTVYLANENQMVVDVPAVRFEDNLPTGSRVLNVAITPMGGASIADNQGSGGSCGLYADTGAFVYAYINGAQLNYRGFANQGGTAICQTPEMYCSNIPQNSLLQPSFSVDPALGAAAYQVGSRDNYLSLRIEARPSTVCPLNVGARVAIERVIIKVTYEPQGDIDSVKLEPLTASNPLDQDPNYTGGFGYRIFTDKMSKNDQVVRDCVRVRVRTRAGRTTVYLKAFDMDDDPSRDSPLLDPGGKAGGDNYDQSRGLLTADVAGASPNGATAALTVKTDRDTKEATALLWVSHRPGDNYKVGATTNQSYFTSTNPAITVCGTTLLYGGAPLSNAQVAQSELITTWRRVFVEVDNMEPVPDDGNSTQGTIKEVLTFVPGYLIAVVTTPDASYPEDMLADGGLIVNTDHRYKIYANAATYDPGDGILVTPVTIEVDPALSAQDIQDLRTFLTTKACKLYDDDNYDYDPEPPPYLTNRNGDEGERLRSVVLDLIRPAAQTDVTVFAPAYVVPVLDESGNTFDGSTVFVLNSATEPGSEAALIAEYYFDHVSEREPPDNDHWHIYLRSAYQCQIEYDGDLNSGAFIPGTADARKGWGASVFLETHREEAEDAVATRGVPLQYVQSGSYEARLVAQLIAHLLGCTENDGGLMDNFLVPSSPDYVTLKDASIQQIRRLSYP